MPLVSFAETDNSALIAQLLAQIKTLQAQLQTLQSQQNSGSCHTFTKNLKVGDNGSDVLALIRALEQGGSISYGEAGSGPTTSDDAVFTENVASAVTGFQEKYKDEILTPNGLQHGTGFVGKSTRAKLNQLYGCSGGGGEGGIYSPPPPLTVTAPNGGEQWQIGDIHMVLWKPYDPNTGLNTAANGVSAYLEKRVNGQYVKVGKVVESGKASIHWDGSLDTYGNYPSPGNYYIRVENSKTGQWDRSDNSFILVARGTIRADLKINNSDGPVTVPVGGGTYTASWTSNVQNCTIYNNSDPYNPMQISNLPSSGDQTIHLSANITSYATQVTLVCTSQTPIEGSANDQVNISSVANSLPLTVTSPNGGEQWQLGSSHTILWSPYDPQTQLNVYPTIQAYLDHYIDGKFVEIGKVMPAGKASIHWEGEIDTYGNYPPPGNNYSIRLVNTATGQTARSNSSFTLVARGTIHADLKVNGSDGPINVASDGKPIAMTASWDSNADSCTIYNNTASTNAERQINNLPSAGNKIINVYPNFNLYNIGISVWCTAKVFEGQASDNVEVLPVTNGQSFVSVAVPNGGEQIDFNTSYTISVQHTTDIARLSLVLYKNNASFRYIVADLPVSPQTTATGYIWTPSNTLTATELGVTPGAVWKIYAIAYKNNGGTVTDMSDASFRIVGEGMPKVACANTAPGTNQLTGCVWQWRDPNVMPTAADDGIPVGGAPPGLLLDSPVANTTTALNFNSPWPNMISINQTAGPEHYTVRWQGNFTFAPGTYQFTGDVDDGMRVWVNGQKMLDDWRLGPLDEKTFTMTFATQQTVPIQIDYMQQIWAATAKFGWTSISSTPAPTPSITVLSPNGGETWQKGTTQQITWSSGGLPAPAYVYLKLRKASVGDTIRTMSGTLVNQGTYAWIVPSDLPDGNDYTVQVISTDGVTFDESNAPFSIVSAPATQPSVTVLSPNGGEMWQIGSTQTIRWSGGGTSWTINLLLNNADKTQTVRNIALSISNAGSYQWTIPNDFFPGSYSLRIACQNCSSGTPGWFDDSDAPFSIVALPTPAPALSVNVSSDKTTGITPLAVTFTAIATNVPSCGVTQSWAFGDGSPSESTTESCAGTASTIATRTFTHSHTYSSAGAYAAQVTINGVVSNVITMSVSAPVIILPVVVSYPNGGESWAAGTAQTVRWSGGGTNWTMAVDIRPTPTSQGVYSSGNITNSGSFTFTVPSTVSLGQYYAYVTCQSCSVGTTGASDGSDTPFTIGAAAQFTQVVTNGKLVTANYTPGFGSPSSIADGTFAAEGTLWNSQLFAVKLNTTGPANSLTIDLGVAYNLTSMKVQADGNDAYRVEYSLDHTTWTTLSDVSYYSFSTGVGLRTRTMGPFSAITARYVRIYAIGGDDQYSVSEVSVWGTPAIVAQTSPTSSALYTANALSAIKTALDSIQAIINQMTR